MLREQRLCVIYWENGTGAMVASIGWELERDEGQVTIAAALEEVTDGDFVPGAIQHIPTANIHIEHTIGLRTTA